MRNKSKIAVKRQAAYIKDFYASGLIETSCDCRMRPDHDAVAGKKLSTRLKKVSVNCW